MEARVQGQGKAGGAAEGGRRPFNAAEATGLASARLLQARSPHCCWVCLSRGQSALNAALPNIRHLAVSPCCLWRFLRARQEAQARRPQSQAPALATRADHLHLDIHPPARAAQHGCDRASEARQESRGQLNVGAGPSWGGSAGHYGTAGARHPGRLLALPPVQGEPARLLAGAGRWALDCQLRPVEAGAECRRSAGGWDVRRCPRRRPP